MIPQAESMQIRGGRLGGGGLERYGREGGRVAGNVTGLIDLSIN